MEESQSVEPVALSSGERNSLVCGFDDFSLWWINIWDILPMLCFIASYEISRLQFTSLTIYISSLLVKKLLIFLEYTFR